LVLQSQGVEYPHPDEDQASSGCKTDAYERIWAWALSPFAK
jgi:hypothetical protein